MPHGHQGQGLDVGKPRGPDAHPVRHGAPIADHVEALLAPGMLRGGIGLAPGERGPPADVDEMVDQAFDVLQGVLFPGDGVAVVIGDIAPGGHLAAACWMILRLWRISATRTR